jgi:hypothetical protein
MPKQQTSERTSKKRVNVNALPKKRKRLSAGDMKKVKGGESMASPDRTAKQKELLTLTFENIG